MQYWVFNKDMLDTALRNFAEGLLADGAGVEEVNQLAAGVKDFLASSAAAKLRGEKGNGSAA